MSSYLHLQYGNTPLMLASQFGHVECVKVLSDRGAQAQLKDKVSTRDLSDSYLGWVSRLLWHCSGGSRN